LNIISSSKKILKYFGIYDPIKPGTLLKDRENSKYILYVGVESTYKLLDGAKFYRHTFLASNGKNSILLINTKNIFLENLILLNEFQINHNWFAGMVELADTPS